MFAKVTSLNLSEKEIEITLFVDYWLQSVNFNG